MCNGKLPPCAHCEADREFQCRLSFDGLPRSSVIIDYVDDVPSQRIALAVLAAVTVLTAAGIVKLSLTDVGLTQAIREVWLHQD